MATNEVEEVEGDDIDDKRREKKRGQIHTRIHQIHADRNQEIKHATKQSFNHKLLSQHHFDLLSNVQRKLSFYTLLNVLKHRKKRRKKN